MMAIGDLTLRLSGGTVRCESIRQWRRGGKLEGLPTRQENQRYVEHVLDRERRRGERAAKEGYIIEVGEPYLVPPMVRPIPTDNYPFGEPEALPPVTCVARYVGWRAALTIIWFQDEYAFPIAPDILEHLEGIDFATLAVTVELD